MCYQLSKRSLNNLNGVHPDNILVITESIKVSPIDFGIPSDGGVRLSEYQFGLFKKGRSCTGDENNPDDWVVENKDDIVTKCDGYKKKSKHQLKSDGYGHAWDFYAYVSGGASWKRHHLSMVASVFLVTASRLKKEGRISSDYYWGGQFGCSDFTGWDSGHMEKANKHEL